MIKQLTVMIFVITVFRVAPLRKLVDDSASDFSKQDKGKPTQDFIAPLQGSNH